MSTLLDGLIDSDALQRVRQPLERAATLPPAAYTRPEVFPAEVAAIFRREWQCVARVDQLAGTGDFLCADLAGLPIVLTRARDGALRALSRICLHRAMPLIAGSGNVPRLVCPYHNWTYDLDGSLRSAPMMEGIEGFDTRTCRLPSLAVEVWNGFVFVNPDPAAPPLAPRIEVLAGKLAGYRCGQRVRAGSATFDSPWNWKLLVENFIEAYHHTGTHRQTLEPLFPARAATVEDNAGAPWALLRMPGHAVDGNTAASPLLAAAVFPTLLLAASAEGVYWYQLEPAAHDRMRLTIHLLLLPEQRDAAGADGVRQLMEQVCHIHREDLEALEGVWEGLHSPLADQGRLSLHERAIWQFNRFWTDAFRPDTFHPDTFHPDTFRPDRMQRT